MRSPFPTMLRRGASGVFCAFTVTALSGCGTLPPLPADVLPAGQDPRPAKDASADAQSSRSAAPQEDTAEIDWRIGPVPESIPEYDDSALPPKPADSAPLQDHIEWAVLEMTGEFAWEYDPSSSASCDETDGTVDETIGCTVDYKDVAAEFTVDIDVEGAQVNYEYGAATERLPISRDAVEEGMRWYAESESVRCDMGEAELVPLGATGVVCRAKSGEGVRTFSVETNDLGVYFDYVESRP